MNGKNAASIAINGPRIRQILLVILALSMESLCSGCVACRNMVTMRRGDPMAGAPRLRNANSPHMEDVVAHLNSNTSRIQSWRSNNVKIRANQWSLSGTLAVEKGHRMRLVVSSPLGNEVDLGSNDDSFWIWSRRMEPAFVTCKHENMDAARQQFGIPFEPEWLMQALGVSPLPTTGVKMEVDPTNHQARLVEQLVSAHGQPIRRVVLVDLKHGVALEHGLYAYDAKPIAIAKLSGHRLEKANGVSIVMPHRVILDSPQSQLSMTMELGKVQINPESIPSVVWQMPAMVGYEVVHLDAGLPTGRVAIHPESGVHIGPIETARAFDEDDPLSQEQELSPAGDVPGRARLNDDEELEEPDPRSRFGKVPEDELTNRSPREIRRVQPVVNTVSEDDWAK